MNLLRTLFMLACFIKFYIVPSHRSASPMNTSCFYFLKVSLPRLSFFLSDGNPSRRVTPEDDTHGENDIINVLKYEITCKESK